MKLIRELLEKVNKGFEYQVRVSDNANWEDLQFSFPSLESLVDELENPEDHKVLGLPEIASVVYDFYTNTEDPDIIDSDFEVKSFKDDVLKIQYGFTIRSNGDLNSKSGVLTLMPSN